MWLWCKVLLSFTQLIIVLSMNHYSTNIELKGTYAKYDESVEVVFQIPTAAHKIKGVLFLAHGCSHSATDWWPESPSCPQCIGLPIETTIVRDALLHHFAVIALSSYNRVHKCWGGVDVPRASKVIKQFYDQNLAADYNIPLHLLGGSSGGNFVGVLAQSSVQPKVSSLCVQISSIHVGDIKHLPPTMFVIMPKDQFTLRHVEDIHSHVPQTKIFRAEEKAITSTFFYDHSNGNITDSLSNTMQQALLKNGYLHETSLKLLQDPRESDWRVAIEKALPDYVRRFDPLVADRSAVSELLNVAWAMHELTDEFNKEMMAFFIESQQSSSSSQ